MHNHAHTPGKETGRLPQSGGLSTTTKNWIKGLTFVLPLGFLAVVLLQPWVEPKWMFLDPLTAAELSGDCCHTYYGFISNLGVMLWSATAAVCLFAGGLFLFCNHQRGVTLFALSAGVLTAWLALDDAFLVHEVVLPSLGIPQNAVLASYAALALIYILVSWRFILSSDYWVLLVGGAALALSMVVDTVFHSLAPALVHLEDGAKFFGIFCWTSFHISTCFDQLLRSQRRQTGGASG